MKMLNLHLPEKEGNVKLVLWMQDSWTRAGVCALAVCAMLYAFIAPALVWAQEVTDIEAAKEIIEVATLISAGGLGTVGIIAAVATGLTKLLKWNRLGGLVAKLPKGWRFVVPVAIAAIGGFFTDVYSGTPLVNALFMAATAGPLATFLHARASSVADSVEG